MLSHVIKYLTYALRVTISSEFVVLCHCGKRFFFCRLVRYANASEIERIKVVKWSFKLRQRLRTVCFNGIWCPTR